MKNIRAVILTLCAGTFGSMSALAQSGPAQGDIYYGSASNTGINFSQDNSAFGVGTLQSVVEGSNNSAFGAFALQATSEGYDNSAFGISALQSNNTGSYNSAFGADALVANNSNYNSAFGIDALTNNTGGTENTGIGAFSLYNNTTGNYNTAIGMYAFSNNLTGNSNIGIGLLAGYTTNGSYNIEIGNYGIGSDDGVTRIGTEGQQTTFYAAGINGVGISGGVPVFINSDGQLGTVNSSIRFKEDVHDMGDASSAIFLLRPVTYRYKQAYSDGSKPIDYGLIAEEVAKVYPDMVVKGTDGQIQTVQYQKLTPMLLNELQKQHQLLEQQEETIQKLERRLDALESVQASSSIASQHTAE